MATLAQLRTSIEAKLNTLVGTGKPIKSVSNFHTIANTGFPYATFEPSTVESQELDTMNNLRNYTFDIFIFQETTAAGRQAGLQILADCFDAIINAFDSDYTLGGLAEGGIIPVGGDFGQVVDAQGDMIFANIKLKCNTVHSLT